MKLTVKDLCVATPRGTPILKDISFASDGGEAIGITGPSGAGKSTLLFALAGLYQIGSGSVTWNVTDLAGMNEAQLAKFRLDSLGMIFQDHLLFDELSPKMNADIASFFGDDGGSSVGTLNALNVPVDRARSAQLSGGERQRVAIARALAGNPRAVLADEPSASLDHDNRSAVLETLFEQTTGLGKTLIVVSHDPQILYRMDRVLTLANGELQ